MKQFKFMALGLLVAGMMHAPSTGSAASVVNDSFEGYRSKTVAGWTEIEKKKKSVKVKNNKVVMKDAKKGKIDAAIITGAVDVSTGGNRNLNLAFNWKAKKKNEKKDSLLVSYREDGGEWITLFKGSDKKGKKSFAESIDFVLSENVQSIEFMVSTDVSNGKKGKGEGFALMDFSATGDRLLYNAFEGEDGVLLIKNPLPGTLPLILGGLGGMGLVAKRKRRRKAA